MGMLCYFAISFAPHCEINFFVGYDVALAKFTLKKFLLLVLFLDAAKKDRLIDYDPCLFCVQSDIKVYNFRVSKQDNLVPDTQTYVIFVYLESTLSIHLLLVFPSQSKETSLHY